MPKFFKQNLLTPPHLLDSKSATESESEHSQHQEDHDDSDPTQALLVWKAPARPYRKKDRSYYTTVAILLVLVSLIALLAGEKLLIGALFALAFMVYVLNFIPPEEIEYHLSNQGVTIDNHFYHWQELDSFWLANKDNHNILYIPTYLRFPGMLIIPLGEQNIEEVKKVCAKFLPFHEIPPSTFIDRWSERLQKHFPLENPQR